MRKINEENQNQEPEQNTGASNRGINKLIKDGTKRAANVVGKLAKKVVLKVGITVILPILLIFVLLSAFVYFITIDDATYKEGDMSSVPYAASTYVKSVTIDGNGLKIHIKDKNGNEIFDDPSTPDINEAYQYLWDQMIKSGSTVKTYLDTPEELVKMMNTEIITQYPYIDTAPANALNGVIKFKRPKELGESGYLKYIDKNTFQSYIDTYNSSRNSTAKANALSHFTLDDEGNAVVAKWTEVNNTLDTNDPDVDPNSVAPNTQTMTTTKINYKSIVRQYTLPFNYMWAWLVIGEDKTFIFGKEEKNLKGFIDLVENTKLEISILDNTTTIKDVDKYDYNKNIKTDTHVSLSVDNSFGASYDSEKSWTEERQEGPFYKTYTKVTIVDSLDVQLTYADTWIIKYEHKFLTPSDANKSLTQTVNTETYTNNIPDGEYELKEKKDSSDDGSLKSLSKATDFQSEVQSIIESSVDPDDYDTDDEYDDAIDSINVEISSVKQEIYKKIINNVNTETITTTVDTFVQDSAGKVVTPKLDKNDPNQNFMTILTNVENTQTRTFVLEIPDWLFEILETNSDTANMVDLTKFILYKLSGISYGVTEYDFSEYLSSDFSNAAGGIVGSNIEEKVWFGLKKLGYSDYAAAGAMGNIRYESGSFNPSAVEGGYSELTGGIGICQWTNNARGSEGRNTNLRNYALSKGTTWQDENIQVTFLLAEVSPGGGADGYATYELMNTQSYYGSALASPSSWINATAVEDATQAFCYSFERPSKSAAAASMPTRTSYAQAYYNQYNGKEAPASVNTTLTGENKEKMEQMLTEAIRIAKDDRYQYSQSMRESEYYYDCSSFVSRLYSKYFGISRLDYGRGNSGTDNIYANCHANYTVVSMSDIQPGDVLWRDGHAALYIGNNQTAEAASTNSGIVVRTVGNFTEAYRIFK